MIAMRRRAFLSGVAAVPLAAPAIVRAEGIMPVSGRGIYDAFALTPEEVAFIRDARRTERIFLDEYYSAFGALDPRPFMLPFKGDTRATVCDQSGRDLAAVWHTRRGGEGRDA